VWSSSRLWESFGLYFSVSILVPLSFDSPSLEALWTCAPLYISLQVQIVPNVLSWSFCGWPRKSLHLLVEGQNQPIVRFAYLCHVIGEEFVFLSFLFIKLFEFGVEVAFKNRSAVTHNKINLLKFPFRSSCSERIDDAFVLLICFCFFHF